VDQFIEVRAVGRLSDAPYLSVVAASRNDNHGGGLRERMQHFVSGLAEQCDRFSVPAELILVEWNPPGDRPKLSEALSWPPSSMCDYRIIEVPAAIHARMDHGGRLPLFQMIAKNVGIRRARASFILATNIDILFNDELFEVLAKRQLRENAMYRVDRYDAHPDVPVDAGIEERLEWCAANVVRINYRSISVNVLTGHRHGIERVNTRAMQFFTWVRRVMGESLISRAKKLVPPKLLLKVPPRIERTLLHTNACGDFTLLHRKWWESVRGYAEWQMYSFHIDSLLCHAAFHAGAEEIVLTEGARIYHIEHKGGWSPDPSDDLALDARLQALGLPYLSDEELDRLIRKMYQERRPLIFNDDDWGLIHDELPETEPRRRAAGS